MNTRDFYPVKDAPADTILPTRATEGSAGYDFYAPCDIYVPARGMSKTIPFNIKVMMFPDEYLQLTIRSSLATKHGIILCTSGVVDRDYYGNSFNDGNIGTCFANLSKEDYTIKKGERCMQGIFLRYETTFSDKPLAKRKGGYGSTGL